MGGVSACGAAPDLNRPWHTATPRNPAAAAQAATAPTATPPPAAAESEAASQLAAPAGAVTIAVDAENPPFMYADADGKAAGLYPKLLTAVFERMGVPVTVAAYPWKRALEMSEKGEVGVGGIYKNEKRLQIYDYSEPIYAEKILLYTPKGKSFDFNSVDDLQGKQIGILTGWSYGDEFDQAKEAGVFTVQEVSSDKDNLEKLLLGRVDAVAAIEAGASQIIEEKGYGDRFEVLPNPLVINDTYLVFSKGVQQLPLLGQFNQTLAEMKQDGTYAAITGQAPPATEATVSVPAGTKTVKLATLEWPPYVGSDMAGYGFTSEVVAAAFKQAGYNVTVNFLPWERVLQETEDGNYDAGYPAYYSDERAQKYLLSEPFAEGYTGFYKRKADNISYSTLEDLKDYRIGVVQGYVNSPEFDAADYLLKEEAIDEPTNLNKLLAGRIDLTVADRLVGQYIINTTLPEAKTNWSF